MKIRITVISILLILMVFVGLWKPQDPEKRLLKREFEYFAKTRFKKASIENIGFYLLNSSPQIELLIRVEEELPTWLRLVTDLYADPTLAEYEPYIYASKLLQKNLKSRNKRKFLASLCLSYFKPDTSEVRCIEEYAQKLKDEEDKSSLFRITREINERFYKMQYGLMKETGLKVILPQMSFFERPPESDFYMSLHMLKNGLLAFGDRLFSYNRLLEVIDDTTKYERNRSFCIFFHADRATEWKLMWEVLGPLIELSKKSPANIEFFFMGRKFFDAKLEPEPYELGIKFKKENKPLKNVDIDIRMDEKGDLLVNGEKKIRSDLESLPSNKNIRFTFNKLARMDYVLSVLSLIKKSNPNDYYYVVE